MGHPTTRMAVELDFHIIYVDGVSKPYIVTNPVKLLHQFNRAHAKHLNTKLFLIGGFGKMRVEMDAVLSQVFDLASAPAAAVETGDAKRAKVDTAAAADAKKNLFTLLLGLTRG